MYFVSYIGILIFLSCCNGEVLYKDLTLHDGNRLPRLGIGLEKVDDHNRSQVIRWALEIGYRMIDVNHGSEDDVGNAVKELGIARKDMYYIVRFNISIRSEDEIQSALDRMLKGLQTTYIDMVVIDYADPLVKYKDAWTTVIKLKKEGKIKSLAIGNMQEDYVDFLMKKTGEKPTMVHLEMHPYFFQSYIVDQMKTRNVVVQGYLTLANGLCLNDSTIVNLAKKLKATPAQVVLAHCLHNGLSCIFRSSNRDHLEENFKSLQVKMRSGDVKNIASVDKSLVLNFDPDNWEYQDDLNIKYYGGNYQLKYKVSGGFMGGPDEAMGQLSDSPDADVEEQISEETHVEESIEDPGNTSETSEGMDADMKDAEHLQPERNFTRDEL